MPTSFGHLLQTALETASFTQRSFAKRVGANHSFISRVCCGRRGAPYDATLQAWAKVLGITDKEALEAFKLAASLSRADERVREHVSRLEERLAEQPAEPSASSPRK